MGIFIITEIESGAELLRYCSSNVQEIINGIEFPLSSYTHAELVEDSILSVTTKFNGRRILTKLEFRSLFSDATIKWIDRFEAHFEEYGYLTDGQKDEIRTAFANYHEATNIDLDDPRWLPGLRLYVVLGGMDLSEVTEVLNG